MTCLSSECVRRNFGSDAGQIPAGVGLIGGGTVATVFCITGQPLPAALTLIPTVPHLITAARIGCLRPWSDLGHNVDALGNTAANLAHAEEQTGLELQTLRREIENFEGKLKSATEAKEALEKERESNITRIEALNRRLEESGRNCQALAERMNAAFDQERAALSGQMDLSHSEEVLSSSLASLTRALNSMRPEMRTDEATVASEKTSMQRLVEQLRQETTRIENLMRHNREEIATLQEVLAKFHEAEQGQRAVEERMDRLLRRVESVANRSMTSNEPITPFRME